MSGKNFLGSINDWNDTINDFENQALFVTPRKQHPSVPKTQKSSICNIDFLSSSDESEQPEDICSTNKSTSFVPCTTSSHQTSFAISSSRTNTFTSKSPSCTYNFITSKSPSRTSNYTISKSPNNTPHFLSSPEKLTSFELKEKSSDKTLLFNDLDFQNFNSPSNQLSKTSTTYNESYKNKHTYGDSFFNNFTNQNKDTKNIMLIEQHLEGFPLFNKDFSSKQTFCLFPESNDDAVTSYKLE